MLLIQVDSFGEYGKYRHPNPKYSPDTDFGGSRTCWKLDKKDLKTHVSWHQIYKF